MKLKFVDVYYISENNSISFTNLFEENIIKLDPKACLYQIHNANH